MYIINSRLIVVVLAAVCFLGAARASAHCDTLDGPVVQAAKAALEKGDVQPVLKWVRPQDEPEIRAVFGKALKVRGLGEDAKQLADLHFFETLVRLHRLGEGVGYSGLRPAGAVDPGIKAADESIVQGSSTELAHHVAQAIAAAIQQRFERVMAAKPGAEHNVEAGRTYVAAYVEYVHFVEAVHGLLSKVAGEQHHPHAAGH